MTKRERLYPEIKRLRERDGLTWREIGERLGVSLTTACDYYLDPTGDSARARKAKTNGACRDCGQPTTSDGSYIPERCRPCRFAFDHAASVAWIIDSIRDWAEMFGVPPSSSDWNQSMCRIRGWQSKIARYASTGRDWPSTNAAQSTFGSWNAALEAAGFKPLSPNEWWLGRAGAELQRQEREAA
jgi:hypothetical protein